MKAWKAPMAVLLGMLIFLHGLQPAHAAAREFFRFKEENSPVAKRPALESMGGGADRVARCMAEIRGQIAYWITGIKSRKPIDKSVQGIECEPNSPSNPASHPTRCVKEGEGYCFDEQSSKSACGKGAAGVYPMAGPCCCSGS